MMKEEDRKRIAGCLEEAGCSKEEAEELIRKLEKGEDAEKLLHGRREEVLAVYRKCCHQLDCLDYLLYCLRNRCLQDLS